MKKVEIKVGSVFGYMKVHCPICKGEMDGMHGYGRNADCCGRECYEEWEWRRNLAIMETPYYPRKGSRWDPLTAAEFASKRIAELEKRHG